VGSHGGDPLKGVIGLLVGAIFGVVDDLDSLTEVFHAFFRERGSDEVGSKTFYGPLLMGMDPFAAENVAPGVYSTLHHADELPGDFSLT